MNIYINLDQKHEYTPSQPRSGACIYPVSTWTRSMNISYLNLENEHEYILSQLGSGAWINPVSTWIRTLHDEYILFQLGSGAWSYPVITWTWTKCMNKCRFNLDLEHDYILSQPGPEALIYLVRIMDLDISCLNLDQEHGARACLLLNKIQEHEFVHFCSHSWNNCKDRCIKIKQITSTAQILSEKRYLIV